METFFETQCSSLPVHAPRHCLKMKRYYSSNLLPRNRIYKHYKMATEGVVDDSKNESGIPRAIFVVRNLCTFTDNDLMKIMT